MTMLVLFADLQDVSCTHVFTLVCSAAEESVEPGCGKAVCVLCQGSGDANDCRLFPGSCLLNNARTFCKFTYCAKKATEILPS